MHRLCAGHDSAISVVRARRATEIRYVEEIVKHKTVVIVSIINKIHLGLMNSDAYY